MKPVKNLKIIFPSSIVVGYNNRQFDPYDKKSETYKLGFIVFRDGNKLRKEISWNDWRDNKIATDEFDNTPQVGFKIFGSNKRSSDWFGTGRNMIEILHPKGFVFEVTVDNFVAILAQNDIIKGEITAMCVLAWSGAEMSLIPTNSELYKQAQVNMVRKENKVSLKDISIGDYVVLDNGSEGIYLGCQHTFMTSKKGSGYQMKYEWTKKHFIQIDKDLKMSASLKVSYKLDDKSIALTNAQAINTINEILKKDKFNETYYVLLVNDIPSLAGATITEVPYNNYTKTRTKWIYDKPYIRWNNVVYYSFGTPNQVHLHQIMKPVLTDTVLHFGFLKNEYPYSTHNFMQNKKEFSTEFSYLFEFNGVKVLI